MIWLGHINDAFCKLPCRCCLSAPLWPLYQYCSFPLEFSGYQRISYSWPICHHIETIIRNSAVWQVFIRQFGKFSFGSLVKRLLVKKSGLCGFVWGAFHFSAAITAFICVILSCENCAPTCIIISPATYEAIFPLRSMSSPMHCPYRKPAA